MLFYFIGYITLICVLLWLQYKELDIEFFYKMNEYNFFFIHGYKTMGTTIYHQLPEDYKNKYYGQKTIDEYEKLNNIRLNKYVYQHLFKNSSYIKNDRISFDHIPLDELYDLGVLNDKDIKNKKCICIVREPIERFISICNFHNSSPTELIDEIKNREKTGGDLYNQSKFYNQKYNWNIKLIKMDNKHEIIQWFKQFGIEIHLDIYKNKSSHKYTINDLTDYQISYLKDLYKEDYDVYNSL